MLKHLRNFFITISYKTKIFSNSNKNFKIIFMKVNHRRKDKWTKGVSSENSEWYAESTRKSKAERREKHQNKNKRLHQYHNLKDLFEGDDV
jgi:hypothetical protein